MTHAAAAHLGITLSCGSLQECKSCVRAKAHQHNVSKEVSDNRTMEFNERVMHNLSMIKVPNTKEFEGIKINKPNWHLMVDEVSKFK